MEWKNEIILIILSIVAIILMTRGIVLRIKGKTSLTPEQAAGRIPSLRHDMEVRDQLQRLLIDLQELARQINGHIDTRFCKLQVLLKEADQKIKCLEALAAGQKNQTTPSSASTQEEPIDPERKLIYQLADAGKSPIEIAGQLNKNTGEIELILSLRRSARRDGSKIDYRIG